MPDDLARARAARAPIDLDAITARAEAAPGGSWVAFTESLWLADWTAPADDEPYGTYGTGRWLTIAGHDWHAGSEDPPPALWTFLASSRADVLALAAEVRRLRAALVIATRKDAA